MLSNTPPYLLGLGGFVCFVVAIRLVFLDKIAGATLMSALFLVCVVLAYFPQLDSIRAFSVDVRLRKTLDRAEEILTKLRNISVVSARATYLAIAWNSRLGGMSAAEKQGLADSVDAQLQEIGISAQERRDIARPHLELIGYDLYIIFYHSARDVLLHRSSTPTQLEGSRRLTDWEAQWRPDVEVLKPHLQNGASLTRYMNSEISPELFGADDFKKLENLAAEIGAIFDQCMQRNGYTDDAIKFLDTYRNTAQGGGYYTILINRGDEKSPEQHP